MSKNGRLIFKTYDPYITSPFGDRIDPFTGIKKKHYGTDYGTDGQKLPVYPIDNGKVLKVGYNDSSGNYAYVNFPRLKLTSIYQHLDRVVVSNNLIVDQETIIGYTGTTGLSTGIHLHFGIFKEDDYDKSFNQKSWFDFENYDYVSETVKTTEVTKDDKMVVVEEKINKGFKFLNKVVYYFKLLCKMIKNIVSYFKI